MFGWFKKKKQEPPSYEAPASSNVKPLGKREPLLAFVLLDRATFPFDAVAKEMARSVGGRRATDAAMKDGTFTFQLGDEIGAIALMPPYPWSELKGPCETSWMWPDGTDAMSLEQHKGHLMVTLLGGTGSPIERRLLLTAIVALLCRQPGVVGVLWPDAMMVHHPKIFAEMAAEIDSPEAPPLYLWVDFRLFGNDDDTVGLFTTGMAPLGHMEMEIPSIEMPPGDLREWCVNIAYYLLENGPILKHGETIGMTAEHKVSIRHLPSRFGHEGKVLCFGSE